MMHRVAVLTRHNLLLRLRDPSHLVSYLVMPMVLMLVFKPMFGEAVQPVTGLLVMFSVLSMADVATATLTERVWHTWDRVRATRASVLELVVAKAVPVFCILLAQQALLLVYGVVAVGLRTQGSAWPLVLAVCTWCFALLGLGTAIAAVVRSHGELSTISNVGALAVSALGGALVPVAMMPDWAQAIAPISPGYWATTALRAAVRGEADWRAAAILTGLGLVSGTFACWRLKRGWGRSSVL
ncbi:ABC transporter permease [Nonomuraea sp. NPDC050556]|uniref:ABC transporter permease n=1 Tax=Nonomuraea sp. NPDC050556 TaxID=3364369 RepID=UPI0037A49D8A